MILLQNLQQLLNGNNIKILLLFIFVQCLIAQDKISFEKGLESFNNKNYHEAIYYLQSFTQTKSQYTETATLILILSYYQINDYEKSVNLIEKFVQDYPHSSSLQKVLEIKFAISIIQKDFEGVESTLKSFNRFKINHNEIDEYTQAFKKIFSFTTSSQNFELGSSITNPVLKYAFLKAYFENAIDQRNTSIIKDVYKELVQVGLRNGFLNINKMGVLIPIDTKPGSVENLIIEGLKFAVHNFNRIYEENIELMIYKGEQKELEKALVLLSKDPEVLCVVGPLYSEQFKQLSLLADKLCIPLISPTATATDISLRSKYIFQFNPTYDVRGFAMASYAIDRLKLTRFALISPSAPNLKEITKVIKDKIKKSKSELIVEVNWDETKKNLSSKIRELRKAASSKDLVIRFNPLMDFETEQKLISYGMTQSRIDSLKYTEAEVSIFEIFGKDAEKICQSSRINYYKRSKSIANDLSVPVYLIDAVFIPISKREMIADIINEIERQNIITQIIGNDIWNSLEDLNKSYPASNGLIFTSDFYFDTDDKSFKDLMTEVYEYTGIQPNRTFFYGFETGNKILENWNFSINRENFYELMINDKDYEGYSSDIILNKNGVNSSVFILEYRNRKINKLARVISD